MTALQFVGLFSAFVLGFLAGRAWVRSQVLVAAQIRAAQQLPAGVEGEK